MNTILHLAPYLFFLPNIQCFTLSIRSQEGGGSSNWVRARTQSKHHTTAIHIVNRKHSRIRPYPPITTKNHHDIPPNTLLYASLSADEQRRQPTTPDAAFSLYPSGKDAITEQTSQQEQVESPLPPTDMIVKLQSYIMNIRLLLDRPFV